MSLDLIQIWHEKARPKPDTKDFNVQAGVHFEEVAEMLEELTGTDEYSHTLLVKATVAMHKLAETLKSGTAVVFIRDREALLDSLCDQIVTSVGVGHCARMQVPEGTRRVNVSNWSKYGADGKPLFDANGKIAKADHYAPPDLGGLY